MAVANTDLTQGSALTTSADYVVTGTGIFDDLMEAVNIHLDAQFQLGRITGADYATVYLGAMQSALQNSASFTLGKEKTNADVILTGKQGLKVDADKLLTDANELLVDAQKLKVDADVVLTGKQGTLTDNQSATELKKSLDIVNQTTNRTSAQTTAESTAVKQRLLLVAQTSATTNQSATELKKALDLVSQTSVRATQSTKDGNLKDAQKLKVNSETSLLGQKEITEYAQTQQTTKVAPNANSILGKQAELYEEQAKGFKWNADQKYLDTLLRAWGMNVNTAGVPSTAVTSFGATGVLNINTVISDGKPTP